MVNSLLNNQIRQYLLKIGLDFSNYGSMFIKTGLIYMIEQCDIIYSKEIYKKLSIEYNKEIETIKKGIRISINDALKRGVFNLDGHNFEKLSTKKAFIILYEEFIKQNNKYYFN